MRDTKKPLGTLSVAVKGEKKKQLVSFIADFDMDDKGEFKVNDGVHSKGSYINIFKSDFEILSEFQYFYLLRYREKPELLLKEDYKYYFEETLKNIDESDSVDAIETMLNGFYSLLTDIINLTKRLGFMYYTHYEYFKTLAENSSYIEFDDDGNPLFMGEAYIED